MNCLQIIGNLVRDPETRTANSGAVGCYFTVAVNRKKTQNNPQPEADFFRVTAWNKLGEVCAQYLARGKKVAVIGEVSASAYQGQDGTPHASLNVLAKEIEFLSARTEEQPKPAAPEKGEKQVSMTEVAVDDLPF